MAATLTTVLAIDIGIRNLSMCIMGCQDSTCFETFNIKLWNTFDTLESDEHRCKSVQKNGKLCNKICSLKYCHEGETVFICKTHYPKGKHISKLNKTKKKLIKEYLLQDIASIILKKMQAIYDDNVDLFESLDKIVIELQPTINPRMKFISHIIYGKLVELMMNTDTTIRFVGASKKLKGYSGPFIECKLKGAYAKRKWLSIQYAKWFLNKFQDTQNEKWATTLDICKADDYADTMLMAINSLK